MMSEERTQNLPNDELLQILSHLTSINARLNRVDARLDSIDARLERLEARDYDTKPIWENALKEIADTRAEMREGFEKVSVKLEQVDARFEQANARLDKLQAGVDETRGEMVTGLRKVAKQIDVMNRSILEVQAELRFMDDRVTKLEPQPAP